MTYKERLTLELLPLCYVRDQSFGQDTLAIWAIPFNVHPPSPPPYGWIFLKGDYKVVSEGLSLSASLISAIFLRGIGENF
jgi:hypothetical protein